jgi:signal peptidase I
MRLWQKALLVLAAAAGTLLVVAFLTSKAYRIPSSAMETTFHCARPASGCEAGTMDRILVSKLTYHYRDPKRGDIATFHVPPQAQVACGGLGGVFVKRIVAVPGDRWREQNGYVYLNDKRLAEPYVDAQRRDQETIPEKVVPNGEYLMLGDNRSSSCDSRRWGTLPRKNLIGPVYAVYWPPKRIGLR